MATITAIGRPVVAVLVTEEAAVSPPTGDKDTAGKAPAVSLGVADPDSEPTDAGAVVALREGTGQAEPGLT